jgi:Zn-dependent protease
VVNLIRNIIELLLKSIAVIFAITMHEYIKALTSTKLCDPLPKNKDRLTLNPVKHFDTLGFLGLFFFNCGWGKPVLTSSLHYQDKKKGTVITYTLPSIVNFLIGVFFYILLVIAVKVYKLTSVDYFYHILEQMALSNIYLAIANIIPIYPLDGAKVLSTCLSQDKAAFLSMYEKVFQILLVFLMISKIIPTFIQIITVAIFNII